MPAPASHPEPPTGLRLTSVGLAWLAFALTLGVVGWFKTINILLLLADLMGGLLVVNAALAVREVRGVRAARVAAGPRFADEPADAVVRVENTGTRPATVEVVDAVGLATATWLVHQLPAGGEADVRQPRGLNSRGRFAGDPLLVASGHPFGFVRQAVATGGPADVVVLPSRGRIDPDGLRRWLHTEGGGGLAKRPLRRVTADQADVRGVRPYRPGDGIRNIHWRSSARRGEPMVREYDAAPAPDLVLVVEPWLPADPTAADRRALEAALSLAATLAWAWATCGHNRLTVAVVGAGENVRSGPATEAFAREALAPLAGVEGTFEGGLPRPEALGRGLGGAVRVVVSSRSPAVVADALARAVGRPFLRLAATSPPPWYLPPPARTG